MSQTMTPEEIFAEIDRLAWQIDAGRLGPDGLAAHQDLIDSMTRFAGSLGVSPVLVGVLADTEAPEVVRIRAYGKVAFASASALDRAARTAA